MTARKQEGTHTLSKRRFNEWWDGQSLWFRLGNWWLKPTFLEMFETGVSVGIRYRRGEKI